MPREYDVKYDIRKKYILTLYAIIFTIPTLYTMFSPALNAATFVVNTTDDDPSLTECVAAANDCSLRGAIIKANANVDADTILLPQGTYTLEQGALSITTDMHIIGEGAKKSIIDGMKKDRVFLVSGLLNAANVIIEGVTIKGGATTDDGGGLKLQFFSRVSIADSVLTENEANDGGAAHLSFLSTLMLTKSTVSHNKAADSGGAIHIELNSTATLNESTVSYNEARSGGGIFNAQFCLLNLSRSTIDNNKADENGGGVHNNDNMVAAYSRFTHNVADRDFSGNGDGGGVFNNGTSTFIHSHITDNIAVNGGGIASAMAALSLTMAHSTVSRNDATTHGGGIFNDEARSTVSHSTINNNTADSDNDGIGNGGGFFNRGILVLDDTPVKANKAVQGNAVYNEDTLIVLGNVRFEGNNDCDDADTGVGCPKDNQASKSPLLFASPQALAPVCKDEAKGTCTENAEGNPANPHVQGGQENLNSSGALSEKKGKQTK